MISINFSFILEYSPSIFSALLYPSDGGKI